MSTHSIEQAHGPTEVTTVDWNKYEANTLATGGIDRCIRLWDLRFPGREMMSWPAHEHGLRRLRYSPFQGNELASGSYDMSLRVWDVTGSQAVMRVVDDEYTEFVTGLDWHLQAPGRIASCSWDETVNVIQLP